MIPLPDTWVYFFSGDGDAAHEMDADGGGAPPRALRRQLRARLRPLQQPRLWTSSLYSKKLILIVPLSVWISPWGK